MTFVMSNNGIVYERNLGPDTIKLRLPSQNTTPIRAGRRFNSRPLHLRYGKRQQNAFPVLALHSSRILRTAGEI